MFTAIFTAILIPANLAAAPASGTVQALACAPSNPQMVLAVIHNNIWISADGGKNWHLHRVFHTQKAEEAAFLSEKPTESLFFANNSLPSVELSSVELSSVELSSDDPDSNLTDATEIRKTEFSKSKQIVLKQVIGAVADNGNFAVWLNGILYTGSAKNKGGFQYQLKKEAVQGLEFDLKQRLWVALKNRLECIENGRIIYSRPITGISNMAFNKDTGFLILSCARGIKQLNTRQKATPVNLKGFSSVSSVAFDKDGVLYLVLKGRLKLQNKNGTMEDVARVPFVPLNIFVDQLNNVYAKKKPGQWFRLKYKSWRKLKYPAMARDSLGRVWVGSVTGPELLSIEDPAFVVNYLNPNMGLSFDSLDFQVLENIGQIPCEKTFNPLPIVKLTGKSGRSNLETVYFYDGQNKNTFKTWLFIGVTLSWNFRRPSTTKCLDTLNKYISIIESKKNRLRQLWLSRALAMGQVKSSKNAAKKIMAQMELNKIDEMIRILSGTHPKGIR